jgi:uncharacterized protein (DUF2384 family)
MNVIKPLFAQIHKHAQLKDADIADILGIAPETLCRAKAKGSMSRCNEQKLLDLKYVIEQLSDFYDPMEIRLWLFARQKLLDGKKPADLLQAGDTDSVISVIAQLQDGAYV